MVTHVIGAFRWIEVVPVLVVDRDTSLGSVPVIQMVVRLGLWSKIVRIINVRVVVESIPIGGLAFASRFQVSWIPKRRNNREQHDSCKNKSFHVSLPGPSTAGIKCERVLVFVN